MSTPLLALALRTKRDLLLARHSARQIARLLSFDPVEQARIAATAFELGRQACRLTRPVTLHFQLVGDVLHVFPRGSGRQTPPRLDPQGVERLWARLYREPGGGKARPLALAVPRPLQPLRVAREDLAWLVEELAREAPFDVFAEIRRQNREILELLEEILVGRGELKKPAA